MNKKLISNSLNVLYAKIAECHSKALTTEVSAYLMMAVAKMFRLLYSAEPHNAQSLFSVEARRWPGYSDAVMRMSESNVEDLLAGEDLNGAEGVKDPSCLAMTTESLTREYPLYTPQPAESGQDQRDPCSRPGPQPVSFCVKLLLILCPGPCNFR